MLHAHALHESARPAQREPLYHGARSVSDRAGGAEERKFPHDHEHSGIYTPGDEPVGRARFENDEHAHFPEQRQPLLLSEGHRHQDRLYHARRARRHLGGEEQRDVSAGHHLRRGDDRAGDGRYPDGELPGVHQSVQLRF